MYCKAPPNELMKRLAPTGVKVAPCPKVNVQLFSSRIESRVAGSVPNTDALRKEVVLLLEFHWNPMI